MKKKIVNLPKGVHRIKAKGRYYYYHRATKTRIKAEYNTADFFLELQQLENEFNQLIKDTTNKVGTLGYLIKQYRASLKFERLAPRTRKDYDRIFVYLEKIEDMPVQIIDPPFLEEYRDDTFREKKIKFTNLMLTVFSILFNFGMVRGLAKSNPRTVVNAIPKPKNAKTVNRPWTNDELKIVEQKAKKHVRIPIMIARYTGLRKGDVLDLKKSDYKHGILTVETNKTGEILKIPVGENLKSIFNEIWAIESIFICTNSYGQKWTSDGFNSSFQKFRNGLFKKNLIGEGLTFHGLRHTFATKAKEEGFSDDDVALVLGHADPKMTKRYNKSANNQKTMLKVLSIFDDKKNIK